MSMVSEPQCRMDHRCILYVTSRYRRPRADQAHGHRPAVLHLASCVSLTDRHSHAIESPTPLILGGRGVGTKAEAGNDGLPENVQGLVSSAGSDITVWFERGKDETLPTRRTCDGLNSDYCTASIHDLHSILLRVVPCFYACTSNSPHLHTSPGSPIDIRPTDPLPLSSDTPACHPRSPLAHLAYTTTAPTPTARASHLPSSTLHTASTLLDTPSSTSLHALYTLYVLYVLSALAGPHHSKRAYLHMAIMHHGIMASWHHSLEGPVQLLASRSTLDAYPPDRRADAPAYRYALRRLSARSHRATS
jgi:hypothetical protein